MQGEDGHGADHKAEAAGVAQGGDLVAHPVLVADQVAVLLAQAHGLVGVFLALLGPHRFAFSFDQFQIFAFALFRQTQEDDDHAHHSQPTQEPAQGPVAGQLVGKPTHEGSDDPAGDGGGHVSAVGADPDHEQADLGVVGDHRGHGPGGYTGRGQRGAVQAIDDGGPNQLDSVRAVYGDHEHQADKHADGQGGPQEPVSDFAPLGVDAIHYVAHDDVSGAVDEHAN